MTYSPESRREQPTTGSVAAGRVLGAHASVGATRPPSTASAIAEFDRITDRALAASVGVALHHFTDPLGELPTLRLHRATTMLSKQVRPFIDRPDGLESLALLMTDPRRVAMPDGQTAAELCGDRWEEVAAIASQRIRSARQGAEDFGQVAVLNLAVIRCVNCRQSWWGTAAWKRSVETWRSNHSTSRRLDRRLSDAPELLPDDVLGEVLCC